MQRICSARLEFEYFCSFRSLCESLIDGSSRIKSRLKTRELLEQDRFPACDFIRKKFY